MFAGEVFIEQVLRDVMGIGLDEPGLGRHQGHLLQDDRIGHGFLRAFAPDERSVMGDQHCRAEHWVQFLKTFHDELTRIEFVIGLNLFGPHDPGAGNGAAEVIGVGGSENGNFYTGLCPNRRLQAVRMDNGADAGEVAVELQMGRRIGAGIERALFYGLTALQIHQHDMFGSELVIGHPGRLDGDQALLAVNGADVAPGQNDQGFSFEPDIGLADLFFDMRVVFHEIR